MARLRRNPDTEDDTPVTHTQQPEGAKSSTRTTQRRRAARRIISDDSSAEDSEAPKKLIQKTKSSSKVGPGKVRLGAPKSLSNTSLTTSKADLTQRESLFFRDEKSPRKARQPTLAALKQKRSRRPSPPTNQEPELCEDEGEVDVEESIWCGSIDGSSSSSEDELPDPRKFLSFPRKGTGNGQKAPTSHPPDISKQLQTLRIFDDDSDHKPLRKVDASHKSTLPEKRPGSSSDKENNAGIIRFSPPRNKKPQREPPIERPATPPPPASPSKSKLQSPSKRPPRIPTQPLRPSLDAFWTADTINDWNDQYSPQKPLKSPRKLDLKPNSEEASPTTSPRKSPTKRTKAEMEARKAFDTHKLALAENFLQELDQVVAKGQIQELSASTGGVKLIWSKTLNSTAGRANWRRETTKTRSSSSSEPTITHKHFASIELASKVIDNEHRLLNVIAHEFCHLCNFMISGIKDQPHGRQFKIWGKKCSDSFGERGVEVTTKHSYEIEYKYIWQCVEGDCGMEFKRHSKSIDTQKHRCGGCKSKLVQIKPVPRKGAVDRSASGTPVMGATPVTGYAAFVKEHFASLKKSMPGAPHKEVMEALGKKYRAEKASAKDDGIDGIAKDLEAVKLRDRAVIEVD